MYVLMENPFRRLNSECASSMVGEEDQIRKRNPRLCSSSLAKQLLILVLVLAVSKQTVWQNKNC